MNRKKKKFPHSVLFLLNKVNFSSRTTFRALRNFFRALRNFFRECAKISTNKAMGFNCLMAVNIRFFFSFTSLRVLRSDAVFTRDCCSRLKKYDSPLL